MSKTEEKYARKVMLLIDYNPKKAGTMSWARFENYFTLPSDATIKDALKAGVRMDDIRHDEEHGFIAVGEESIKDAAEAATKRREQAIEAARKLLAEVEAENEEAPAE